LSTGSGKIVSGLGWKLLERFGVQGSQFILQLILARLLDPEHYGTLSLMVVFTTLANVFVQSGLNTALIQRKDVDEDDYSSILWVSMAIAGLLYVVLFFCAPLIALLYKMPEIVAPFRVLALMLFPGALNSVQIAKTSREMNFRRIFFSNLGGILVSGAVGIAIAYLGGGLWALVIQTLLNVLIACAVMHFTVGWKPRLVCDLSRVKLLFRFGWKLLFSRLIDTIYQDVRSLVIGVKYNSATLGYYNRGKHFPQFVNNAVNGAVQSVMLPAMSARQEDKGSVKSMMRTSVSLGSYIVFPVMAGLASVASPLVALALGEKWMPCVPYLQIYCFTFAFYPVHSCNLQALNAIGRSDVYLRLEIIKKSYGIIALVIAVLCFDSPIAIAMTGVFTTVISCFVNAFPSKKLIGYSYLEQMRDILPALLLSAAMFGVVSLVGLLKLGSLWTLLLQISIGVGFYVGASAALRLRSFTSLKNALVRIAGKRLKK